MSSEHHELSSYANIFYLSICNIGSLLHWYNINITTILKFQFNVDHTAMHDIVLVMVFNWSEYFYNNVFIQRFNVFNFFYKNRF